ncbi:MAG: hypothetical protein ABJ275_07390 [Maricaulaceae bacterium]
MSQIYENIMDSEKNPLMQLAVTQRFQMMVLLSTLWTVIFTASISVWFLYGVLWIGYIFMAVGLLLTPIIFQYAPKSRTLTYRDFPREDGTARYDDVWGA